MGGEGHHASWQNIRTAALLRVGSLNNVPSQVRTTVVPEVPSARRWEVRRFWAVLISFGRFQRRYTPKTHLDPGSKRDTEHYLKSALVLYSTAMILSTQIGRGVQTGIWISPPSEPRRTGFAGIAKYLLVYFWWFPNTRHVPPTHHDGFCKRCHCGGGVGRHGGGGRAALRGAAPACAPRAPRLTADQKVRIGMSCECAPSRRARSSARLTVEPMHPVGTGHALAGTAELRAALDLLAAKPRRAP